MREKGQGLVWFFAAPSKRASEMLHLALLELNRQAQARTVKHKKFRLQLLLVLDWPTSLTGVNPIQQMESSAWRATTNDRLLFYPATCSFGGRRERMRQSHMPTYYVWINVFFPY